MEIFQDPAPSKFPSRHHAPEPLSYTLSKYIPPVKKK
jgi:hypothetical protein